MQTVRPPRSLDARPSDVDGLLTRLDATSVRDAVRLRRRLEAAARAQGPARSRELAAIEVAVDEAVSRLVPRAAAVPTISYPPSLPVSARRDDIAAAIRDHQVVVVAGETGSGKTTQLPKICLELGRGVRGLIGHTQPRRIAARAVAERLAEELETTVGGPDGAVGYAVRFTDEVGPTSLIKLMTDGILLAEVQRDRDLLAYDTIIIDEAHERSLTIDFLLGYLHRLLPRRPDLKVIITSATIDPQRFADHFATPEREVPVVEVSGRTFPVEVRYRPLVIDAGAGEEEDDADADPDPEPSGATIARDATEGVMDAVLELAAEGDGDVLVFLSGEREIRDTADALARLVDDERSLRGTEVLPLYGRLSAAEQHKVFSPHSRRRIVLATNVAETSLTVPGIRYVVDTGTARISRYSTRTKVQRLPIEPISQASANQRSGRCGRVADGIAIRLYSEADYEGRPRFTDPEVQRTSLASVILAMASLGLGEVADFPFLDAPDARQVRDGVMLLTELGALDPTQTDPRRRLTALGRRLAAVPADPRLARMLAEAERLGVVGEVLVIVAALSVQDVRERPTEAPDAAAASHKRFADENSDLVSVLNLWAHLQEQARERSGNAFRRMCREEFLHYLRIREWQDVHAQLRRVLRSLGIDAPRAARSGGELDAVRDAVHQALLSGLLSQVGVKDERVTTPEKRPDKRRGPVEYTGARGARFAIAPGSALAKRTPSWVMAAELVETSRLWARQVARIDPAWIEELAAHLVVRSYSEPRWSARQASAVATEKVTLYGLPVVAARTVAYGRIDGEASRELFIRHALVGGEWNAPHAFRAANAEVVEQVEELAARTRRRDLVADDEVLFAFYDARVPAEAVSGRAFDAWWRRERRKDPDLMTIDLATALAGELEGQIADSSTQAPSSWTSGSFDLDLSYRFEPGHDDDGVTVHIPLAVLDQVSATDLSWGVPAYRGELVTSLLRSLPKALRVQLVPVPDTARELLSALPASPQAPQGSIALTAALADLLRARRGIVVPPQAWDWAKVPGHLRATYALTDEAGERVAAGKDLDALRAAVEPERREAVRAVATAAAPGLEAEHLAGWPAALPDGLPASVERIGADGRPVVAFPAFVVEGDPAGGGSRVALRLLASEAEARAAGRAGLRALVRAALPPSSVTAKSLVDALATPARLALARSPHGSAGALVADCAAAAVDALVDRALASTKGAKGAAGAGGVASAAGAGGVASAAGAGGVASAAGAGGVASAAAFTALVAAVAPAVPATAAEVLALTQRVLSSAREVERALDGLRTLALAASGADARAQLAGLVHPGFVAEAGMSRLPDVQRYLRALLARLQHLARADAAALARDAGRTALVTALAGELDARVALLAPVRRGGDDVAAVRWQLQELRVSLFAQAIGTPAPVSEKRVRAAIAALS